MADLATARKLLEATENLTDERMKLATVNEALREVREWRESLLWKLRDEALAGKEKNE